jgi:diguanylate cyclase (GGDEF)-like protein
MIIAKNREFRPFLIAALISVLFLLFQVILVYIPIGSDLRTTISDIISPMVGSLTTIGIFFAATRTKNYSNQIAKAWFFLGYAQLAYFLGDLIWAILEVGLKISPFPSIADIPYLIYYPLFFFAVLQFPSIERQSYEWLKRLLDLVIIVIGGVMLYWNYVLGPITQLQTGVPVLTQVLAYAYPVGDLVLFWAIMLLLYNRLHEKNGFPLVLISLGITVMVIADCFFSIESLNETYIPGGLIDLGFIIQNILVFLAAVWQFTISVENPESNAHGSPIVGAVNSLFSYFPYLWLLASIIMLINSHFASLPMSFPQIAGLTIILLVLVFSRQLINNIQNSRLIADVDSARKKIDKQARELHLDTLHDFLTGLPNRELFMDRLDSAILSLPRHSTDPFTVLFLDLDNFKNVNDSKGHLIGDKLLIEVAKGLKNCVRAGDTIARLGGDEFLILLENAGDKESIEEITQRILDVFKKPFAIDNVNLFISVSIGIVFGIAGYEGSTDILRDADIAMYHAKELGKSRFAVFTPTMRTKAIKRVLLENELRYGLEYQQFRLLYQPIYSLKTEKVIGFEALIRWENSKLGNVMPGEFIPVAEETGLINEIGDWVLNEACRQMMTLPDQLFLSNNLSINVNVSGYQFSDPDFTNKLKRILELTAISPAALKLEITESVLLNIQQRESNLFSVLRDMGVHLEIDDFGTGYSSLSYLQNIPVDVLKIDRSFVQMVGNDGENKELIKAIVNMAQSMGMDTTAEGIETKGQMEMMKALGCSNGQGYFWAKPMEFSEIEKLIPSRKSNY